MLNKDTRPQIEKNKGAGVFPLNIDVNQLIDASFDMETINDLVSAYYAFIHVTGGKNAYERFKRLSQLNLDDLDAIKQFNSGENISIILDACNVFESNQILVVSQGFPDKTFLSLGKVVSTQCRDGKARTLIKKLTPLP